MRRHGSQQRHKKKRIQILATYGKLQERFEALGGYTQEHRVEAVLQGLGFGSDWYDIEVGLLSGGEKKLVNLLT